MLGCVQRPRPISSLQPARFGDQPKPDLAVFLNENYVTAARYLARSDENYVTLNQPLVRPGAIYSNALIIGFGHVEQPCQCIFAVDISLQTPFLVGGYIFVFFHESCFLRLPFRKQLSVILPLPDWPSRKL